MKYVFVFALIFIFPFSTSAQPTGSEPKILNPPVQDLFVTSDAFDQDQEALSFGTVPAVKFADGFKFTSPMYKQIVYLVNASANEVKVASVDFEGVSTNEPENPFSTCGLEFPGFTIEPEFRQSDIFCFHPSLAEPSSAMAVYRDANGEVLFSIPMWGSGRKLVKNEIPPLGAVDIDPDHFTPVGLDDQALFIEDKLSFGNPPVPMVPAQVPPACTVSIVGGGHIPNVAVAAVFDPASGSMTAINTNNVGLNAGTAGDEINVGQFVHLGIDIRCPPAIGIGFQSAAWTIGGPTVKDYDETLTNGTVTTTPLAAADLARPSVPFYWTRPGTHTVSVAATFTINGAATLFNATRKFIVEINQNDIDRQMEDFYTWNHAGKVLTQHGNWHVVNRSRPCVGVGEAFFTFHRSFLGSAKSWRSTFGPYPGFGVFNPARNPPVVPVANQHAARGGAYVPFPKPTYLNRGGGPAASRCYPRVFRLKQFATARDLGLQVEGWWHNTVHGNIGGDMGNPGVAPKDPVFYKWHQTLDDVYTDYQNP